MFFKSSLFLISCTLNLCSEAEVFTAISELVPLLQTLDQTIEDLEYYVEKEKNRVEALITQLNLYKKEQLLAAKDYSEYLENPVNAYILIKRLTTDLDFIKNHIQTTTKHPNAVNLRHGHLIYPTIEDLIGSALALARLQNTYMLNVTKLAEGRLTDVFGNSMTVNDCFKIGQILLEQDKNKHSLEWLIEALRKHKTETETYGISEMDILKYISHALYYVEDAKTVLRSTKQILDIDKEYTTKIEDVISFLETLDEVEEEPSTESNSDEYAEDREEVSERYFKKEQFIYGSLCRGEVELSDEITKRLKCSYLTNTHPFLKLAPIKMEQVYIEPDAFVFHNVISDEEIEHLKILSKERLQRSEVAGHPEYSNTTNARYRISKTAWLYDSYSPVVERITRRVAHFTGLSMATAEPLQIVNYGIGGHFTPHFDFYLKDSEPELPKIRENGNRIGTVIFYMSEVAQGGATVFTELGLSVLPVKYAALFWMNLHPSGDGDISTRHAACPVLRGSKWISNKWLHQVGQEIIRPCNLEYQMEKVKRNIVLPTPKTSDQYHRQRILDWFTNNGLEKCMYE